MLRAALLLALDHGGDRQRQLAGDRLVGAASLDEGHGLAFIVAGPARDDDFAPPSQRLDARLERRGLPEAERVDWLHVVMPVEQHARSRRAVRLANDHRVALGRTQSRLEADGAQVLGHVFGGGAAMVLVGGVGRHRGDAQQGEQTLKAMVEILIDAAQYRLECAHGGLLAGRRRNLAMRPAAAKRRVAPLTMRFSNISWEPGQYKPAARAIA